MTAFGWRDSDAIWQEQLYVLLQWQGFIIPVICHGSYLHLLVWQVNALCLFVAMLHLVCRYFQM